MTLKVTEMNGWTFMLMLIFFFFFFSSCFLAIKVFEVQSHTI